MGSKKTTTESALKTTGEISTEVSYCRVCHASCGVLVDIQNGKICDVRGDPDNPLTNGYICSKGRESAAIHHGKSRLRETQKRNPDGIYETVSSSHALDEIAAKLNKIVKEDGPDSVALFSGTFALFGALTIPMARGWLNGLDSRSLYTTGTIDQSSKWIVPLRMGRWQGGWQNFEDADVWLLVGTNPMVSMQGGDTLTGFPAYDPVRRLRSATANGLKLIVIDPRETETARHAHLYLQPKPGQDAAIFACLIHVILQEKLYDVDFCQRYVGDLGPLSDAVSNYSPGSVADLAGIHESELVSAARLFGNAERGMAHTGTGPDMGPFSNLTAHLAGILNVICGRYARAGDRVKNPGVLKKRPTWKEGVLPPDRHWETGDKSRIGGFGALWGERPTTSLPDEILQQGKGRIRALIVVGGNPVACWPDQHSAYEALEALDLLVVIDPRMTETAELADYVIAPTLPFERPDHTWWYEDLLPEPYAQYTSALIKPPPNVIDDWRVFYELSRRMNLELTFAGKKLSTEDDIDAKTLLRLLGSNGQVSYDELLKAPHGKIFDLEATVQLNQESKDKFVLLPEDVAHDLESLGAQIQNSELDPEYPLLLISRRARQIMNSYDQSWKSARRRLGNSTAWVHPNLLEQYGIAEGEAVIIESANGKLETALRADSALRGGVISMPHGQFGASTGALVDSTARQSINAMPRMSAIPVRLLAVNQK